jgi:dihydroorotate dehydrogenase (NAD+) catalytic subunit
VAGACAVEIGTANFLDPAVTVKVARGVDAWLDAHSCKSVREIIGVAE